MPESLFERFDSIKLRLVELQQEDDNSAEEIRSDLFAIVKVTGLFDEYLENINNISFAHRRLIFNKGHIEKIKIFNAARENLLRIIGQIQKEISAKEEHDAMMRAFHKVPSVHELEVMPDIDLAELQSQLPPDSPGKIIIENELQRRKSSQEPKPAIQPSTKQANKEKNTITHILRKHWQWIVMFALAVIGCVFNYPTFHQFIKQAATTETQKEQITNSSNNPEKSTIHKQLSSNNKAPRITKKSISASEITKRLLLEEWRNEIQSFVKDGIFDREQFLMSKTYYEIAPYLSESMKKDLTKDLTNPMYAAEQFSKKSVSHRIILNFPAELDRIANEYR